VIDSDSFGSTPNGGASDTCLGYAREAVRADEHEAAEHRRRAELRFHSGRRDEALACGRRALTLAPGDPETLYFCAWLFSNCGCHEEAASTYLELLRIYPDWADGYRHASGSLAEVGAIENAADYAVEACARAPENGEWALHAGVLLLRAGRVEAAADYLRHAVHLQPENCRALRETAAAHYALGQHEEAAAFAERAVALDPKDTATAVFAAELLLRCSRADAAVEILYRAAARDRADPVLLRTLSAAEIVRRCFPDALAAIDAALALAPENAEYHIHRGHVLVRLGELRSAEAAFDRAARLDPTNPDLTRAQIDLYLTQGRISEATALGGGLLHRRPDDPAAAQTVLHVLGERLNSIDADYLVLHDGAERPPRPSRPLPGFLDRLRNQRRVIRAVIVRETRTRFGESKLGYGWALLEPILHIALLSVVFSVLMRGQPPIGSHFFLFYYTGLVRY
jgi:tetratricopeptide (TPR) repeat protein